MCEVSGTQDQSLSFTGGIGGFIMETGWGFTVLCPRLRFYMASGSRAVIFGAGAYADAREVHGLLAPPFLPRGVYSQSWCEHTMLSGSTALRHTARVRAASVPWGSLEGINGRG